MLTIKVKARALYTVSADVAIQSTDGLKVVHFNGEGLESKNSVKVAKAIRESYKADGFKVLAVDNIVCAAMPSDEKTYKFNIDKLAAVELLTNYCVDNGLEMTIS